MVPFIRSCFLHAFFYGVTSRGFGFSRLRVRGMLTGLAKQSNSWSWLLQSPLGCSRYARATAMLIRTAESLMATESVPRKAEHVTRKRCHKGKWNVNHYINSMKKYKDWLMGLFIRSCFLHALFYGVASRGFGFSVMREGHDNRVIKAVKQLELTCTVVNWDARDTREQWHC